MYFYDYKSFKYANPLVKNKEIAEYLGVSEAFVSKVLSLQTPLSAERHSKLLQHPTWDTTMLQKPIPIQNLNLEEFVYVNKISKKDLAEYLGISPSFLSQIISGDKVMPEFRINKLLAHPTWDTAPLLNLVRMELPSYEHPLNLPPTAKPTNLPIATEPDGDVIEAEVVELPIVPTAVVRQPETRLSKWLDKYSDEVERLRLSEIISGATMVREVKDKDMCPALKMGQYIYLELMPREMPIKNGRIYFVDHKKVEGFFRRLYDRGDSIECRADKPAIEPNIYSKEDIYDIYKVVGVFSTDIIDDEDALAKDRQIAALTEQLNRLMAQQDVHSQNTAEALASTNRAIEQSREIVAQLDKASARQDRLIELLETERKK